MTYNKQWGNIFIPGRSDHYDAHHYEWQLLGPHGHIHIHPQPVDQDVECLCDGVHLANSVKHNVNCRDEDLPDTVDGEEVTKEVEIHALKIILT